MSETETRDARITTRIVTTPISTDEAVAAVADPTCGATALFLGVVRNHHEGRDVRHLEYEAYAPMAEKVLTRIAEEICERWSAVGVALIHRTGRLAIGETAVAVAVSTPHRKDAFEAARYGIDELKNRAPIWKKEVYVGGEDWVENCRGCAEARPDHSHDA